MCSRAVIAQDVNFSKIEFSQTVYDFDTINQGDNGTCSFVYKNTGTAPLIISNVSASCGCTNTSYDRKPIMPQKGGVITIKYDTAIPGEFRKIIMVTSNATNKGIIVLTIKGYVKKRVASHYNKKHAE